MAAINDLIAQIQDVELRNKIEQEYLYAGKVDCIYIDPPYNTGAKDWKYNNDYVDGNDSYRHSKWLHQYSYEAYYMLHK